MRYFTASRTASMAVAKQSLGVCGATMGSGASPCRPYMACSRSACSVLVGRPVEGPPRWTSTMTSGSSRLMARPMVSDLRSRPGPLVVVTPSAPPKAAPRAAPMPAISSSAWKVRTPNSLRLRELVQDVGGRRDRVAAQEQRQPGQARRRDEAPGQRLVAGDLDVLALLEGGRLDLVVGLEQLGRLAEVEPGPEGPDVGLDHLRLAGEALG